MGIRDYSSLNSKVIVDYYSIQHVARIIPSVLRPHQRERGLSYQATDTEILPGEDNFQA